MSSKHSQPLNQLIERYGDLIFDLCTSLLWSPNLAQIAFRSIVKKLNSQQRGESFQRYEKAWALKVTYEQLIEITHREGHLISPEEQIQLDAESDPKKRMSNFDFYFHRLRPEQQLLLLMKDKHQISDSDISMASSTPLDSLKIQRYQALRTLEEWIWSS